MQKGFSERSLIICNKFHYSPLCSLYFQVNITCSSQWHFWNVNNYKLFLSSHTLIYHQAAGNTQWPEKKRQPWHFSVRALLLLDIRLPFHSNALSSCLTVYTNGIPFSVVLQNPPVAKESLFYHEKKKKKITTAVWKTRISFSKLPKGWVLFFCFLWQQDETETFQNTLWEKQIVFWVNALARVNALAQV